ncbi:hypothetical protein AMTRI_Chr08g163850 [Amborella trichopoda]
MPIRVCGCGAPTARINGVKIKGPHSKGETLAAEVKLDLKWRQLRPANSRLHSHLPCRDGRPTRLKPFSYSISLSLYRCIHSLSLSKPHKIKNHSLSLSKTRGAYLQFLLSFTNYMSPNTPSLSL